MASGVAPPLACFSLQFVGKMGAVHRKLRIKLNLVLPMTSRPRREIRSLG